MFLNDKLRIFANFLGATHLKCQDEIQKFVINSRKPVKVALVLHWATHNNAEIPASVSNGN